MSSDCLECGQNTQWDDELGSFVCTACGTLSNSTQITLASHVDSYETSSGHEGAYAWDLGNPTLKSIRNKDGRALSGQGKEVRLRQNMFSSYAFISTLCNRLSYPGLASRAQTLFSQAMSKGQFRWGRKAKLTAGASVSIAVRESRKSVSLRDIAVLLGEPLTALTKTYNEVIKLFGFDLEISDPSVHLTTLHAHLTRVISDSETFELPKTLASVVRSLQPRLSCVLRTAESLATLVTRSGKVSHLSTAPTACAIFLLALEGEIRSPLPNCGSLAHVIGLRFDVKQGVIMDRYRILYTIVEHWIKMVPWLQPPTQLRTRASSSKSKVTTRSAVAKGLNDVVQFREEIWKKSLCDVGKISLDLDLIDECDGTRDDGMTPGASHDDGDDDNDFGSVASVSVVTTAISVTKRKNVISSRETSVELISRPIKKRRTRHSRSVESASQFLLDPIEPSKSSDDRLLSHLISSDSCLLAHSFLHPPTRLQLLSAARPGGSDAITDEELFEEGELEDVFRTEEEVKVLAQLVDWDEVEERRLNKGLSRSRNRSAMSREDTSQPDSTRQRRTERIDMGALKQLMDPTIEFDGLVVGRRGVSEEGVLGDPSGEGVDGDLFHWLLDIPTTTIGTNPKSFTTVSPKFAPTTQSSDTRLGEIEEMEDWRPMSPGNGGMGLSLYDNIDYYDS